MYAWRQASDDKYSNLEIINLIFLEIAISTGAAKYFYDEK
jgi:hypothetical protein